MGADYLERERDKAKRFCNLAESLLYVSYITTSKMAIRDTIIYCVCLKSLKPLPVTCMNIIKL
jgi:hypothetical protein